MVRHFLWGCFVCFGRSPPFRRAHPSFQAFWRQLWAVKLSQQNLLAGASDFAGVLGIAGEAFTRQPGEKDGLDPVRVQSFFCRGEDWYAWQKILKAVEQVCVVGAAATYQDI